jgi:hypothetical protein
MGDIKARLLAQRAADMVNRATSEYAVEHL